MNRPLRTFLALLLSLAISWLPMQSFAGMLADGSEIPAAEHCHTAVDKDDQSDQDKRVVSKPDRACCCDGCNNCDSGCAQSVSKAALAQVDVLSIDKHHTHYHGLSAPMSRLSYSPPIPPPLA